MKEIKFLKINYTNLYKLHKMSLNDSNNFYKIVLSYSE